MDNLSALQQAHPELDLDWWEASAEPTQNALIGALTVMGVPLHLCAVRVTIDNEDGAPIAVDPGFQQNLDDLIELGGAYPQAEALPDMDGLWVVWAEPYAA